MKDHEIRELVNQLRDVAIKYHAAGQLREQISRVIRSAMLQDQSVCTCPSGNGSLRWPCPSHPGNSPVIPDGYVMVPKEPTEAMMLHKSGCQHHAWDDPDCAMRQTRRLIWSHMLAAAPQLPGSEPATVPDRWIPVSERMPESNGVYFGWDGKRVLEVNCFFGGFSANQFIHGEITHWMPLPAAPQEVKPWSSHYLPITRGDAVECPFKREVKGE